MEDKRKLPFDCIILDTDDVEVQNQYSKKSCTLPPDAVAVYDVIKGAELLGNHKIMQIGMLWFRLNFPKEYMILLD